MHVTVRRIGNSQKVIPKLLSAQVGLDNGEAEMTIEGVGAAQGRQARFRWLGGSCSKGRRAGRRCPGDERIRQRG